MSCACFLAVRRTQRRAASTEISVILRLSCGPPPKRVAIGLSTHVQDLPLMPGSRDRIKLVKASVNGTDGNMYGEVEDFALMKISPFAGPSRSSPALDIDPNSRL